MKIRMILAAVAVIAAVATASAQQIAVVSEGGETTIYQTLQSAIEGASDGSVIYLPGGAFSISDEVKITKRLTIIGIGNRIISENVDGITNIVGNLYFNDNSSHSAVMGCYITGSVIIGEGGTAVTEVLIKYCNVGSVEVTNNTCYGTIVNQNYIRGGAHFNDAGGIIITNNSVGDIYGVNGGTIKYNVVRGAGYWGDDWYTGIAVGANNSIISYNVIYLRNRSGYGYDCGDVNVSGSNNRGTTNMVKSDWGENCINVGNTDWNDIFENTETNFHFKEAYEEYENLLGIYAGDGFNDNQMAPVPYIVAKRIAEETDAAGMLKIQVRVKAGGIK